MAAPGRAGRRGIEPGDAMALVEAPAAPLDAGAVGRFTGSQPARGRQRHRHLPLTARLRLANGQLSDLRRTVAAQVKFMPPGSDAPLHILRWYDTAWSN